MAASAAAPGSQLPNGPSPIPAAPSSLPHPAPLSLPPPSPLSGLPTETPNPLSSSIDTLPTLPLLHLINAQDALVAPAVALVLPAVARLVDALSPRLAAGGRLIYLGAGTSGRLGVLDASEVVPTFSAPAGQVLGLIAGGERALRSAVEGAEDDAGAGAGAVAALRPPLDGQRDSVIGIAASGRTPWVLGGMRAARGAGALVGAVCCVAGSEMGRLAGAEWAVECVVGPEVVTGSTRMKSGTATKMILNMISTAVQIRLGKTYGNLMVDVRRSNRKLVERSRRIFREVLGQLAAEHGAGPSSAPSSAPSSSQRPLTMAKRASTAASWTDAEIDRLVEACEGSVKVGIVAAALGCGAAEADGWVRRAGGGLKGALRLALEGPDEDNQGLGTADGAQGAPGAEVDM